MLYICGSLFFYLDRCKAEQSKIDRAVIACLIRSKRLPEIALTSVEFVRQKRNKMAKKTDFRWMELPVLLYKGNAKDLLVYELAMASPCRNPPVDSARSPVQYLPWQIDLGPRRRRHERLKEVIIRLAVASLPVGLLLYL